MRFLVAILLALTFLSSSVSLAQTAVKVKEATIFGETIKLEQGADIVQSRIKADKYVSSGYNYGDVSKGYYNDNGNTYIITYGPPKSGIGGYVVQQIEKLNKQETPTSPPSSRHVAVAMKEIKPSVACKYLASIGLATRGWKNYYDDVYGCSSPYKELGSSGPSWAPDLKNNLAYYVDGTATAVRQLKLVLNINNRNEEKKAKAELRKAAEVLVRKALNIPLPPNTLDAINKGKNLSSKVGTAIVDVVREDWPTGKGYEIKVIIK